jgi:hypothetical protein
MGKGNRLETHHGIEPLEGDVTPNLTTVTGILAPLEWGGEIFTKFRKIFKLLIVQT